MVILSFSSWVKGLVAILAALIDSVNVGKEMSRLLRPDKLSVVGLEGDGPVLEPVEVQQGCVGSPSLSCLQTPSSLQTEHQKLKENLILCTDLLLRQDFYKLSDLMVMLLLRFT